MVLTVDEIVTASMLLPRSFDGIRTSSVDKYPFALSDITFVHFLFNCDYPYKETKYVEEFMDTKDRYYLKLNVWIKSVLFSNHQPSHFVLKDDVVSTNKDIQYRRRVSDLFSDFESILTRFRELEPLIRFEVTRRTYTFNVHDSVVQLNVDVTTYPDKDNHVSCSLSVQKGDASTLRSINYSQLAEAVGVMVVRSKVVEYLYRYQNKDKNDSYAIVEKFLPDTDYETTFLQSELGKLPDEEYYKALLNIEGKRYAPSWKSFSDETGKLLMQQFNENSTHVS